MLLAPGDQSVAAGSGTLHLHHAWHCAAGAYAICGKPEKASTQLRRSADSGLPNYKLFSTDPYSVRLLITKSSRPCSQISAATAIATARNSDWTATSAPQRQPSWPWVAASFCGFVSAFMAGAINEPLASLPGCPRRSFALVTFVIVSRSLLRGDGVFLSMKHL